MIKHWSDMMILPVASRREFFRKMYAIELGKLAASGGTRWPLEQLPAMIDRAIGELLAKRAISGPAFEATKKAFGVKTQKDLFQFLESGK